MRGRGCKARGKERGQTAQTIESVINIKFFRNHTVLALFQSYSQ